jgi:hypothetical protein
MPEAEWLWDVEQLVFCLICKREIYKIFKPLEGCDERLHHPQLLGHMHEGCVRNKYLRSYEWQKVYTRHGKFDLDLFLEKNLVIVYRMVWDHGTS